MEKYGRFKEAGVDNIIQHRKDVVCLPENLRENYGHKLTIFSVVNDRGRGTLLYNWKF